MTSRASYRVFLEVITGANTFNELIVRTKQAKAHLSSYLKPLVKRKLITVVGGVKGNPATFKISKKELEKFVISNISKKQWINNYQEDLLYFLRVQRAELFKSKTFKEFFETAQDNKGIELDFFIY